MSSLHRTDSGNSRRAVTGKADINLFTGNKTTGLTVYTYEQIPGTTSLPEEIDRLAFEETMLPHLDAAFNLARWLTGNEHDAQDIVQDAFVRAFKFYGGFHGTNSK